MTCKHRTDSAKRWRHCSICSAIECRAIPPKEFPQFTEVGAEFLFKRAVWVTEKFGGKMTWGVRFPTEHRKNGYLTSGDVHAADHLEVRFRYCNESCPLYE